MNGKLGELQSFPAITEIASGSEAADFSAQGWANGLVNLRLEVRNQNKLRTSPGGYRLQPTPQPKIRSQLERLQFGWIEEWLCVAMVYRIAA